MNKSLAKITGQGVGKGHGGTTPNLPVIRDVSLSNAETLALIEPGSKAYRMGKARIFVSPPFNGEGWHMSISREDRLPSWDEVAKAWYDLVPDADTRTGVMILPPKAEYINVHQLCLQVHEDLK